MDFQSADHGVNIVGMNQYIEDLNKKRILVEDIQDIIERKLMEFGKFTLAKKYILYRDKHALIRKANSTDESILSLVRNANKDTMEENSNKNAVLVSTQRDLIAGECSKDLADRVMLPERIVKAHNDGVLHFHDKDYFVQPMHNCCLVNIGDMLDNGTVMNGKMIESPKSFQVACTVMTQIIAAVASSQYGGQSVDIRHLGKYLRKTYDKIFKRRFLGYIEKGLSKEEAEEQFGLVNEHIDFVIEGKGTMNFDSTLSGKDLFEEYLKPGWSHTVASHGYLPFMNETTTFIACGKNVKQGVVVERGTMLNEASTMAAMLGME